MKKIYTTIAVVMLASFAFAQVTPREARTSDVKFSQSKPLSKNVANPSKSDEARFWFNYGEALSCFLGGTQIQGTSVLLLQDSTALIENIEQNYHPQFFSLAQVFDMTDPFWNSYADYADNVPDLSTAAAFTIDSINVSFGYIRGVNVPANIVDTLVITIASPAGGQFNYMETYNALEVLSSRHAIVPYDIKSSTIPDKSVVIDGGTYYTTDRYYTYKYLLTVADDDSLNWKNITIPVLGFENISNKQFVISYSYISGVKNRTLTSLYGKDVNSFIALCDQDSRSEFTFGGSGAVTERNSSLCAMNICLDPANKYYYQMYMTNAIWTGNLKRPTISFHATCTSCVPNNVKLNETKGISVSPNPAIGSFMLTLEGTGSAQVELFNLVGQKVYGTTTADQTLNINVANLSHGVYMLKVAQNGKIHTSKVIVK